MHHTNSGKSPKFVFSPTFTHCSPICPNNCGVVFLGKYILVFEKWVFSFDRSNMQIFTLNITRVVWPHVTNLLDLWYLWWHNPLFYHLNLIPCHYWSWKRNIYSLVNIFVRHTFFMSKMGEDACRTFQGSKSVIWYLLRCLKLQWTTRDLTGTFFTVFFAQ